MHSRESSTYDQHQHVHRSHATYTSPTVSQHRRTMQREDIIHRFVEQFGATQFALYTATIIMQPQSLMRMACQNSQEMIALFAIKEYQDNAVDRELVIHIFLLGWVEVFRYYVQKLPQYPFQNAIKSNNAVLYICANNRIDMLRYAVSEQLIQREDLKSSYANHFPIEIACENGHIDIVKFILEDDSFTTADVKVNDCYALKMAVKEGHYTITTLLLNRAEFTDDDITGYDRSVPQKHFILNWICLNGDNEMFNLLESHNLIKLHDTTSSPIIPVIYAIIGGNRDLFIKMLIYCGHLEHAPSTPTSVGSASPEFARGKARPQIPTITSERDSDRIRERGTSTRYESSLSTPSPTLTVSRQQRRTLSSVTEESDNSDTKSGVQNNYRLKYSHNGSAFIWKYQKLILDTMFKYNRLEMFLYMRDWDKSLTSAKIYEFDCRRIQYLIETGSGDFFYNVISKMLPPNRDCIERSELIAAAIAYNRRDMLLMLHSSISPPPSYKTLFYKLHIDKYNHANYGDIYSNFDLYQHIAYKMYITYSSDDGESITVPGANVIETQDVFDRTPDIYRHALLIAADRGHFDIIREAFTLFEVTSEKIRIESAETINNRVAVIKNIIAIALQKGAYHSIKYFTSHFRQLELGKIVGADSLTSNLYSMRN
jgi:hypothetical protein